MSNEHLNVQEIMNDFYEYISKIPSGSEFIYTEIRKGNIQEAVDSIISFSEGMAWIISANNYLIMNKIDLEIDEEKLQEILSELNKALELKDFYLVADIYEYEIKEFFIGINIQ